MTASDLAAVLVAVVVLVAAGGLALAARSLVTTMRELRSTVDELRAHAVPTVVDLRETVDHANAELHKVDELIDTAQRIGTTVDSASRLTFRAFSPPLIKTMSLMTGARRAVSRLRGGRPGRDAIDVASSASRRERRRRLGTRGGHEVETRPEATLDEVTN